MTKILTFVKSGGNLFVGWVDRDHPEDMRMPRMLATGDNEDMVILQTIIGNPNCIKFLKPEFSYECEDKEFEKHYQEVTTNIPGLKIVK